MMGRGKGHAGSPFGCRSIGPIAAHSKAGFMTGASFFSLAYWGEDASEGLMLLYVYYFLVWGVQKKMG
jgi:hypothetical protein